jgi:Na+-transporting NADH:ubiquinone oxidoreductase subunit A
MSIGIKIKKGLDINLAGAVDMQASPTECKTTTVAVIPDDFSGIIPKMEVREGDSVKAGQPLFHSKLDEALKIVSPAAGSVKAIVRGERRKIERVIIEVGAESQTEFATSKVLTDAAEARNLLLSSGLWAMMRQRPYDIVPAADAKLRDIFVTGFDSAPLAWYETDFSDEDVKALEAGVKLLSLLTEGKVYVSRRSDMKLPNLKGAEMVDVEGPHPASNAGTVIAAISPVNKGEIVATLELTTLRRIGRLALTGKLDSTTIVAVTGSEVKTPRLVKTLLGAEIAPIVAGNIEADDRHHRIISGNVLTGVAVKEDGYLRMPYRQVTVIPEGDDVAEFMGWASFSPNKQSTSRSFPGHFLGHKLFKPDARILGGRRAMIMSGEYDKVFPMDILPEYLIKAIIAKDIDRMEQLGIYEVAPEDFALAEYVDTSKLELQKIVRKGLDYLRKELC